MNVEAGLAIRRKASPARVLFLLLTITSIGLLCARKFGLVIPKPLVWLGWLIIELKILLKLKEIFELIMARRREKFRGSGQPASKPSPFVALIMVESRVLAAFCKSFRSAHGKLDGYTFSKAPEYQTFGYVLWFSVLVEVPFVFFLAQVVPSFAAHRVVIEVILGLVSVYALVAFRADRSSIQRTAHQITADGLRIDLGMRVNGMVPFEHILAVEAIPQGRWRVWVEDCRRRCLSVAKVSPLDKPNVAVLVSPGWGYLSWMHGGLTAPDVIALYVDDSSAFVSALLRERSNAKSADDATRVRSELDLLEGEAHERLQSATAGGWTAPGFTTPTSLTMRPSQRPRG